MRFSIQAELGARHEMFFKNLATHRRRSSGQSSYDYCPERP